MYKEQLKAYAILALMEMHTYDGCFEDADKILPYIDKVMDKYTPEEAIEEIKKE
jgi:hypothetical protein